MKWMDELADETFARAMKQTIRSMRNEFRKAKIKRLFNLINEFGRLSKLFISLALHINIFNELGRLSKLVI